MNLRLFALGALCAVVGASACSDPLHITAQTPILVDTLSVYALSGAAPSLPNGLDVFTLQPTRVDGFAAFDIAFDIVSPTQVRVLPVHLVVSSPSGVRIVGLARAPGVFEALGSAPSSGYQTDSSVVLSIGDLMVIQTTRAQAGEICSYSISPYLYAKLAILSVDVSSRLIRFVIGLDPNCGFRSFQPGIPTS